MSKISNPPLDPPGGHSRPASHPHTAGPIVNPPLDGSRAGPAAHADHQNPPLDGATAVPGSDADVLDNPRLDTASVEAWFEARLGSDTVPTTKPTPVPAPAKAATSQKSSSSKGTDSNRSAPKKKKSAAKKPPPRAKAAGPGPSKRSPRTKQAMRKRT